jgi:hypothetical protein
MGSQHQANDDSIRGHAGHRSSGTVSQFRITLAWLLEAARHRLKARAHPLAPRRRAVTSLSLRSTHGFTVLGLPGFAADQSDTVRVPCPFPERLDERTRRRPADAATYEPRSAAPPQRVPQDSCERFGEQ